MPQRYLFRPLSKKTLCPGTVTERLRNDAAAYDFALAILDRDPQPDEISVRRGEAELFSVRRAA